MVVILVYAIMSYIINILRVKFGRRCHFTASSWKLTQDMKSYAAKPKRYRGLVPEIHKPYIGEVLSEMGFERVE